jgi:type IV pilus assembly protein PilC
MAKSTANSNEDSETAISGGSSLFVQRMGSRDVATFCRQLAVLLDAGIPMVRALKILGRRGGSSLITEMVRKVTTDVDAGGSFSSALQTHGRGLPGIVVPLCRAGESAGELSKNLRYLADSLDHDAHIRGKIANALIFPVVTLVFATGLMLFLMLYIAPLFLDLIVNNPNNQATTAAEAVANMDSMFSQMVFKCSLVLQSSGGKLLVLVLIVGGALLIWRSLSNRSYLMDFIKIRTPFLGRTVTTAAMARFGKTLSALLRTGVPVLESLRLSRETIDNLAIEQAVTAMEKSVESGGRMSAPLEEYWYIPELARDMILIGEESGSMAEMLDNLAEVCRALVDRDQDRLVAIIEPAMTILLGGLVLFVLLAMFLPYISLVSSAAFGG